MESAYPSDRTDLPRRIRGRPSHSASASLLERTLFHTATVVAVGGVTLAIGGRHPVGQSLLTLAAVLAVVSWLIRRWCAQEGMVRVCLADILLFLGLAIPFIQLIPLHQQVLHTVSPRLVTLLPQYAHSSVESVRWHTISLVPDQTITGLLIFFAQAAYVWVLIQRVESPDDFSDFLRVVALTTFCLAMLGIAQYLFGNGRFLWFYEPAFGSAGGAVKGTFTNRNHFAGFLAIGFSAIAWWAIADGSHVTRRRQSGHTFPSSRNAEMKFFFGAIALSIVSFATALSLSRGGMLAIILCAAFTTVMFVWSGHIRLPTAVGMMITLGIFAAALAIHGSDDISSRLATLFDEQELTEGFSRLVVWRSALSLITDFPWFGTGVGSHADVSLISMPPTGQAIFTHAESSYLTLGVECGVIGLALACMAILIVVLSCVVLARSDSSRERGVTAAGAGMLVAGAGHAVGDFTWYAPAISTLLIAMGACLVRLATDRVAWLPSVRLSLGRYSAAIVASGVLILLSASAIIQVAAIRAEPAWERSIRQSLSLADHGNDLLEAEAVWSLQASADTGMSLLKPGENTAASVDTLSSPLQDRFLRERRALLASLDQRITELDDVVALRPTHSRAWAELAVARLERFGLSRLIAGESLTLLDVRQTVLNSRFSSPDEALRWVARVTGESFHELVVAYGAARRAVRLTPCAGDAWCVLAVLSFLESTDPTMARNRIRQGTLVRPNHPLVLFEAAIMSSIDGDNLRTTDFLRRSFAASPAQRDRIIALLLPTTTASECCELLHPDLAGLRKIDRAWSRQSTPESMRALRERRIDLAMKEAERRDGVIRSKLLREAAALQESLDNPVAAMTLLQKIIFENPLDSSARLQIVDLYISMGDLTGAKQQLEWCILERGDAPAVRARVDRLRRMQLKKSDATAGLQDKASDAGELRR